LSFEPRDYREYQVAHVPDDPQPPIGASDLRVTTGGIESADIGDLYMSLTCIICLWSCPY
jgi:hypothetical protein